MLGEYITEIGLGGLFALFLVREFLAFAKTNGKQREQQNSQEYRELKAKVERLYEMHRVFDEDGAPIWYRKKITEERIEKMYHSLNNLSQALLSMHEALKKVSERD